MTSLDDDQKQAPERARQERQDGADAPLHQNIEKQDAEPVSPTASSMTFVASPEPTYTNPLHTGMTVTEQCGGPQSRMHVWSNNSIISEDTEKGGGVPLPNKKGNRLGRYLIYNFFSVYRVLFTVIFLANLSAFIAFTASTRGAPKTTNVGNATSVNLMVAILFRQEHFVNVLYEICTGAPHSLPLSIRCLLTKIFHYGGVHSGCGVAATVWYLLFTILITRDFVDNPSRNNIATLVTTYLLITMLLGIIIGAHPRLRTPFHDHFEVIHRFAGWSAIVVFWVHTFLAAESDSSAAGTNYGIALIKSPGFWCLLISTISIIASWSPTKRREVVPERLSDHAIRLRFNYRRMRPFCGVRVSDSPLTEWHAFATIPDNEINGYSFVVSNAGDWTNRIIMNPPKKLYVRGSPLRNLLYGSRLFRRIIVVATGSGIGPCLSLMYADITPRRIFWSTASPEVTYGQTIVDTVRRADEEAIIWDTRKRGRPDMVTVTHQLYMQFQAEAIFIISNPKVTRKVVYGMESRGIPCYGAIFDS